MTFTPTRRSRSGARADGLVFLVREQTLAVVMTVAFVSLLFMSATVTAEVFFAKDILEVGDVGYGALIGTWTLGMALGASVIAPRVAAGLLASGALVAIGVQGLGIALPTLWLVPAFAFGWFLVGGVAHGTKNVLVRTLMHELVPARLHGRAFAAYNGLRNAAELVAMLAGGLLVAAIGARWTLSARGHDSGRGRARGDLLRVADDWVAGGSASAWCGSVSWPRDDAKLDRVRGADGRAGARRARGARARQRPLPDELLGDEGLRRGRLPAGGRARS